MQYRVFFAIHFLVDFFYAAAAFNQAPDDAAIVVGTRNGHGALSAIGATCGGLESVFEGVLESGLEGVLGGGFEGGFLRECEGVGYRVGF